MSNFHYGWFPLFQKKNKSKALLQEGQLLRSDFELEEMRLIEVRYQVLCSCGS